MIAPKTLFTILSHSGINFFSGVPDSLLKYLCAYITDHCDNRHHIIAANEGNAIGLAAGYYLATGMIPVVYMQNSGMGNAANPLISLMDKEVYQMPLLLIIGWRGEPGVHDEPQHIKQGKITIPLLDTLQIGHEVLTDNEQDLESQLKRIVETMRLKNEPFALVVKKGTFDTYSLNKTVPSRCTMSREKAIQLVTGHLKEDDVIVSTTGMISRELFEYREQRNQGHAHDFLTVGSMGHASQIALGISLFQPNRRLFCFDGDGASLMHMGAWAITGTNATTNYYHIVFNNGAHDSVGGQPTVGMTVDFPAIAKACRYRNAMSVWTEQELLDALNKLDSMEGPVLLEIKVAKGARKNLGRPTRTPLQNKDDLMNLLSNQ
ncbi:MAG: phosphonopyruvate decarboxylase [Bacteroidales bacterium]|nr:phosphonopyruvate decarboxylase [Bacteroidales bacterium]